MRKTLILPTQVINYSSLNDNTEQGLLDRHILRVERNFKRTCLGDLYDLLLADTYNYECAPKWDSNTTYAADQYVKFGFEFYRSTAGGNTTRPCDTNATWELASSFVTACYENLWNDSLKYYLAQAVAAEAIPFMSVKVGSKGVVEFVEDNTGIRSASGTKISGIQGVYKHAADTWLKELKIWIEERKDTCTGFDEALFLVDCNDSCEKSGGILSRFGFGATEAPKTTIVPVTAAASAASTISAGYYHSASVTGTIINLPTGSIDLMDPASFTAAEISAALSVFRSNVKAVYSVDFTIDNANNTLTFVDPLVAETLEVIQIPQ